MVVTKRKREDEGSSLLKEDVSLARLDTPFPRGGGSDIAPIEIKRAEAEAARDVYDEINKAKKAKRSGKKTAAPSAKSAPKIQPLSFAKIKVGTLILGQVIDIHQLLGELVVSLPNNLVGYCPTQFVDTCIVGSLLRFVVTSLGEAPRKRLELSYDPELANQTLNAAELTEGIAIQGVVESVEEKGAVLNLGPSMGLGFVPGTDFVDGQPVLAFVKNGEKRIKQLTTSPKAAVAAVLSQPSLTPGSLVALAPIEHETPMGNAYELVSTTTATSDALHSLGDTDKTPAVRVIFSFPPTQINGDRQLGVSIRSHIVALEKHEFKIRPGKMVKVTVQAIKPSLGLFVKFGDVDGFVHVSQVQSGEVQLEQDSRYAVGTEHDARILSTAPLDGLVYLSLDPDILNQRYMSISDVHIGDVVENASVERFLPKGGVLIRLSKGLIGIANELQLSDVPLKNPELRFKQGQRVTPRVLDVDLERNRVELTLKKSIVNDDGPVLQGYEVVENAVGTVFRLSQQGAKLVFFGGVKGWLPVAEMLETTANPEKLYRIGQTVRVRVLEADAGRDRLILSARPNTELSEHVGEVHGGTVSLRTKNEVRVILGGEMGEVALVDKPKVKTGDQITVKILNDRLATSEPLLVESSLPREINDLSIGQEVPGYVAGSQPNIGVFVSFLDRLTGLLSASSLAHMTWPGTGRILNVKVDNIDFSRNRFYLSLPDTGRTVSATITAVKQTQLNIGVNGQQGRVDVSQLYNSIDEIPDSKHPLAQFKEGQTLDDLRIVGRHDARTHKFLPLSHRAGVHALLELSRVPSLKLTQGSKALAFVNNISDDAQALWVSLSPQAKCRVSLVDLTNDPDKLKDLKANFPIGSALQVTVLRTDPKLVVTALEEPSDLALISTVDPFKLTVRLPYHKTAEIAGSDTGDVVEPLESKFQVNQIVRFRTVGSQVTLRSTEAPEIKVGAVVQGIVKNISDGGVFVLIATGKVGRAQIGQLSDTYLKNWKAFKKIGDVVTAKVIEVKNDGKIELSLKPSVVTGKKQPNIDKVDIGKSYKGVIRRIERFGVFVDFADVTGMCHTSEISEHRIDDLSRVFKVGDSVRVKVLSKDEGKQQIALGMKASYFEDEESDEEDVAEEQMSSEIDDAMDVDGSDDDDDKPSRYKRDHLISSGSSDGSSDEDEDSTNGAALDSELDSDSSLDSDAESQQSDGDGLKAGFNWSGDIPEPDAPSGSDSEDDSDDDNEPRVRTKKRKKEFVQDETASMQTRLPQSAKDFERLLVSNPHSSMLWMNYMAFQLQLGEIELARSIAQRALSTISLREEEERMNIWVALLNLEVQFGTPETADKAFRESQQVMDSETMHKKMANVLAQAGKISEAREIYSRALKKFGADGIDIWLTAMRFYFTEGGDKASGRALADRALQRLPQRLHRDFTKQFALLEFDIGDAERGRTLLEALLAAKPRRVDLWNVYIDQELKHGDEQRWSGLFERVLANKITMKQAKFFFKKWINVASDQEYVKSRAKEYVQSHEEDPNDNE